MALALVPSFLSYVSRLSESLPVSGIFPLPYGPGWAGEDASLDFEDPPFLLARGPHLLLSLII